jgi:hypothetical protein
MSYFDDNEDRIVYGRYQRHTAEEARAPRCNRCGSTAVRWRQQGGKWVLFSLKPGIEHTCPVVDEFDALDP